MVAAEPVAVGETTPRRSSHAEHADEGNNLMPGDPRHRSHRLARPRLSAAARRQQLIRVALDEFSGRGLAGATTRQIASKAGVTEAVIFQHFPTKEALYAAIIDHKAAESRAAYWIEEMRRCGAEDDDAGVVRTVVLRILEQGTLDPHFIRLMLHSALEANGLFRHFRVQQIQPLYEFLLTYVTRRQAEGEFRRGDPHTLVRALIALPSHYLLQESLFQMTDRGNGVDVANELTQFALAGLRHASGHPGAAARPRGGRRQ